MKTNNIELVNDIKLLPYTNKELNNFENGKIIVATSENDITKFIKETRISNTYYKLYYGKIGRRLSKKLEESIGLNLHNYNISLKSDSVRHILKHHGNDYEKLRGQIKVTDSDFKLIPNIICNYDEVYISGKTIDQKPVITFTKKLKNKYFIVNYVSDKRHNLEIQTIWIQKKNSSPADNA